MMNAHDDPLCDMTPEIAQMTDELAFKISRARHWPEAWAMSVIAYESLTAMFDAAKEPNNALDSRCMAMCVVVAAVTRSWGIVTSDPRAGTAGSA